MVYNFTAVLVVGSFILTLASAAGWKVPLWVPVLFISLAMLLSLVPVK
jgi:hypothetical protein